MATASSVVAYYKGGRRTKLEQRRAREETEPQGGPRLRNRLLSDQMLTHVSCVCVCVRVDVDSHSYQSDLDGTHGDNAVRLDLVDPEALLHHGAGSVEQLFQLAQSEWANLWETPERSDHTESSGEEQPHPCTKAGATEGNGYMWTAKMSTLETHQVGHVDDIGGFATRRRRLPGGADGIVDGDRHARLLLTNGATHNAVARGNWGDSREQKTVMGVFTKDNDDADRVFC